MYALEYTPQKLPCTNNDAIEAIPFDFSIQNVDFKMFNWSTQSTAFGVLQAKACIPCSVSSTL
jgi:hypothetical protein